MESRTRIVGHLRLLQLPYCFCGHDEGGAAERTTRRNFGEGKRYSQNALCCAGRFVCMETSNMRRMFVSLSMQLSRITHPGQ